jgi:hypothetical protein
MSIEKLLDLVLDGFSSFSLGLSFDRSIIIVLDLGAILLGAGLLFLDRCCLLSSLGPSADGAFLLRGWLSGLDFVGIVVLIVRFVFGLSLDLRGGSIGLALARLRSRLDRSGSRGSVGGRGGRSVSGC